MSADGILRTIYATLAETGRRPSFDRLVTVAGDAASARGELRRLSQAHLLVLEDDGESIEMALPFSGVERPHRVTVGDTRYFANCAWDTFGIVAALAGAKRAEPQGRIESACADCGEAMTIDVHGDQVVGEAFVHFVVPARKWWRDIRFT
jgi:Alkylmercury lyase